MTRPERRVELAERRRESGPALTIASTPRCGREPCAARPLHLDLATTRSRLCATDELHLGRLGDDRQRRRRRRPATSWMPRLACSSSATAATTTSPARSSARRFAARDQRGGEAGLHVVRATAVQSIAVDARARAAPVIPSTFDGVEVTAEQQRAAAAADPARGRARSVGPRVASRTSASRPACSRPARNERTRSRPRPRRRGRGQG